MKAKFLLTIAALLVLGLAIAPADLSAAPTSYIVIANGNKLPGGTEAAIDKAGGVLEKRIDQVGIAVASSENPDFAKEVSKLKGIRYVALNPTVQWLDPAEEVNVGANADNPPFTGDDDFYFDLQWGHDAVDAPETWEMGYRGAGVRVAILDGGFDLDHPDLAPNIDLASSANFVPGEDLQYGLPDPFSHGTHVAGTVAAADNAFGVIGIAPEATLVLVKVLDDEGSGAFSWIIEGIVHAALQDADVINMSLGAYFPKSIGWEAAALKNAVAKATKYAQQMGTVVIASAGNSAIDGDKDASYIHLPSDAPGVLSISATAPIGWAVDPANAFLDYPASYTNYGRSVIELAAPGGDYIYPGEENCTVAGLTRPCWVFDFVFSTGNGGWYWSVGTSMAAPHAAGVAALIIEINGGSMTPAQVKTALRRAADDLGQPGKDKFYGHGRVNAYNAVD